ncbi:MAG TPA: CHASE2 domain-containing protein [Usitatibacter sp.]|nr:CHASE2 domain-containing protein [Usitatibacter sp.]
MLLLFLLAAPFANPLRNVVFDGYQRLFPLERTSNPVVMVLIDEHALATYGQWPWPRTRMADLITRLADLGPASIGLDMYFPEPDRYSPGAMADEIAILPAHLAALLRAMPSNDEQFAKALKGRNVVLGIAADLPDPRFLKAPVAVPVVTKGERNADLQQHSGHIGNVAVIDRAAASRGLMNSGQHDQVVRVIPLISKVQGSIVPALSVETFRVALDTGMRIDDGPLGLLTLRIAEVSTPMHDDGTTYLRMGRYDETNPISAFEVLNGKLDPERVKGKIVLVGMSGQGVLDFKTTPLGEFVPGVALHAQMVENLYNGVSLVRPSMMLYIEGGALLVFGLVLIWFIPRISALQGINLTAVMVLALVLAGIVAFKYFHYLFDFAWPALGTVAVFVSSVVGTLSEAERQRRVLRDQAARMAGEVDAARRIQMGLLPDPKEAVGNDRRFSLAALLEPARTVGGDFYDCFMIDANRLVLIVADVSGKGLPAALFMASVKSHLKSAALRGGEIGEVLTRAQTEIERENPEQLFVTAFAGILDVSTGILEYSSAGHEPPFARTPRGGPERFATPGGPPLCVVQEFVYQGARRRMQPGEWLCAVTDGATEAMNTAREFFGVERLRTSLTWMPEDIGPDELIRRLREDLQRFSGAAEPADDITLLAVRWNGS